MNFWTSKFFGEFLKFSFKIFLGKKLRFWKKKLFFKKQKI